MRSLLTCTLGAPLLFALASVAPAQQPQSLDTVRIAVTSRIAASLVSGQRSVEVIDRGTIDRRAARSVMEVLATAIGADQQSRSPAQADFSLRGSSLGQVLILVDGVRVTDLQTAHFDLDLAVPLDQVDRIEILRGPGSALYGSDAVGGIVNIVTRRGEGWHRVRAHGGTFGTAGGAASLGRAAGPRTFLRAALDGERSSGHREGTDFDVVQAAGGLERAIGAGRLLLDLSAASRNFGAADFYAPAPSYERTRTQVLSLRATGLPVGAWTIASTVAGRRHTDDFILRRADPGFYRNQHRTLQRTAEVIAGRAVTDMIRLGVGLDGFDAELASARLGSRREQRAGAFTEAAFGRAGGASMTAGVRVDGSSTFGTFASPSLSAAIPAGRVLLRASAGRGLRAPSWTERFYADPANVANPDVGAERFWAGEVGVRALPSWGLLDVAAYVRRADALIDWIRPIDAPAGTPWRTANLESATYRGIELSVVIPDVMGVDWTGSVSGLRFDADAAAGYAGKYALRPLTRVVAGSASRALGERLRVTVDARAAQRAGESQYVHANARAALRLGGAVLRLDATNITNASYLDAAVRPVAGRAFTLGLQL